MQAYESITGFAAKFCVLNGIRPAKLRSFLKNQTGLDVTTGMTDPVEAKAFARLLDEPYAIVRTLNGRLLDTSGSASKQSIVRPWRNVDDVRVCDVCLNHGMHLVFAETAWLKQCPLHQHTYTKIGIPSRPGTVRFDSYIETLKDALKQASPQWPAPPSRAERALYAGTSSTPMLQLLRWLAMANQSSRWIDEHAIWKSGSSSGSVCSEELCVSRSLHLHPAPHAIRELYFESTVASHLRVISYNEEASQQFRAFIRQSGIELAIYYYKRRAALAGANVFFKDVLRQCLDHLDKTHGTCQCNWGWSSYCGWQRIDSHGWPHWGFACPFEIAKSELICNWGEFGDAMALHDLEREFVKFNATEQQLEKTGLLQGRAGAKRLIAPAVVEDVLNCVLAAEITACTTRLQEWLMAISAGGVPQDRTNTTGDVILLNENNQTKVLSWELIKHA